MTNDYIQMLKQILDEFALTNEFLTIGKVRGVYEIEYDTEFGRVTSYTADTLEQAIEQAYNSIMEDE